MTVSVQQPAGHRVVAWTNWRYVIGNDTQAPTRPALTDAQLDKWKARGVTGIALQTSWLRGQGGAQDYGDVEPGAGATWEMQRALKANAGRLKAKGFKVYLVWYTTRYDGIAAKSPFGSWFDDAHFTNTVLPQLRAMAGTIKRYALDGTIFDMEEYPGAGGTTSWLWDWTAHGQTEAATRAKAEQRGREIMVALGTYGAKDHGFYGFRLPGSSYEKVVQTTQPTFNWNKSVQYDFLRGLASDTTKYGTLRMAEALFYKSTQQPGLTWDEALILAKQRFHDNAQTRNVNDSRMVFGGFSWVDNASSKPSPPNACTGYECWMTVAAAQDQWDAFRRCNEGGESHLYTHQFLGWPDSVWDQYGPALRGA